MEFFHGLAALFSGKSREFPPTLSTRARAKGRALIKRFNTLNGISITFLMENILILYAIANSVSDPLIAVLSSFVNLTMPFMIVGKHLVSKIGGARTWALGWFFRYVFASLLIVAPMAAPHVPQVAVSAIILVASFGFALFRSMGIVATSPLEGEVTTPENRGAFLAGNHLRITMAQIFATLAIILITRYTAEIWVYQLVIAIACLIGIYSSTVLARIPESQMPQVSARIPLVQSFRRLWGQRQARGLLFAWSGGLVSFMMVIPFMMIAVKNGYGIEDSKVLIFSLILLVGGVSSSVINGMIADQVGPRPILLMSTAGLLLPAGMWAVAPDIFSPLLVGAAFFIAGYCKFGIIVGLNHYFLSSIGDTDRVGSSLFIRVFSGVAAGLSGTVIGGGLLSWLEFSGFAGMDGYRLYFRIILGVLALMILLVRSLEKLNEWPLTSVISLFMAPRDLYAIHVLKHLRNQDDSSEDVRTLKRLGAIGSTIPETELRQQLDSPLLTVRVNALQALGNISFGRKTEDAVLDQLSCGEHTTAWIAAEIVGKHRIERGTELLRRGLGSSDHFFQGKCMVALVRLGDTASYAQIVSLFKASDNPRIIIHGAKALSLMDGTTYLTVILRKSIDPELPTSVVDEVLTAAAATVSLEQRWYHFLQKYNRNRYVGATEFISDLDGVAFRKEDISMFTKMAGQEQPLPHFTRTLENLAAVNDSHAAREIRRLLSEIGIDLIPVKTAFCIALILSAVPDRARPLAEPPS
ncbi:MAG: MFS transporter [Sphaerochaeta sp.]